MIMSMKDEKKNDLKKIFSSGAFLIAMLTFVGYVVAYVFEWSYLNAFGIAYQFVDVTPPLIVGSVILVFGGLSVSLFIIKWLSNLLAKNEKYNDFIFDIILTVFFSGLVALGLPFSIGYGERFWIFVALFFLSYFLYIFFPVWRRMPKKGKGDFFERYHRSKDLQEKDDNFLDRVSSVISFVPVFIALLAFIGSDIALFLAKTLAVQDSYYGVINIDGRDFALVRRYDDRYLFLHFNRNDHKMGSEIMVLTSGVLAEKNIHISFEKVGPLHKELKAQ